MNIEQELAKAIQAANEAKLTLLKQQLQAVAQAGLTLIHSNDIAEVELIQQLAGKFVKETGETTQPVFGVKKPKHFIEFDWNATDKDERQLSLDC